LELLVPKLSEAEVLMKAGMLIVLIANQVVDLANITRLAKLAGYGQIIVAVDQLENLIQIARAANEARTTVHVVIEIDVGMHRSGAQPGEPALKLAKEVSILSGFISPVCTGMKVSPCSKGS
jgi:D-serine deaminase-like pyridoxal phosphate-dependent protein